MGRFVEAEGRRVGAGRSATRSACSIRPLRSASSVATGRSLEGSLATYEDFIQTDAAINQGNSGGALINARGELVGINTAIFSQTGGYQGVGFAVPSNLAKHVMDELITDGAVRRGTITGVDLYPMTTRIAEEFNAPNAKGVIVSDINERSDAYAAGMRQYDIIVSFNSVTIEDPSQFMRMLSDAKIGSTVTLGFLRNGRSALGQGADRADIRRARRERVNQRSRPPGSSDPNPPRHGWTPDSEHAPLGFHSDIDPDSPAPGDFAPRPLPRPRSAADRS